MPDTSTVIEYVSNLPKETKLVWFIAFLGAVLVFTLGVNSDIYLGDEPTHYRIASLIYDTGTRPVYDPNLHTSELGYRPCGQELLWHGLLAGSWWATGGKSPLTAQLYQAGWFAILVMAVYLLGKVLYSKKVGLYGALLVATMPLIPTHTIMFYADVPLAALSALCFWALAKDKLGWSGVFLGLMVLTKRNVYFLIPFILFWLYSFHNGKLLSPIQALGNWKATLGRILIFSIPAVAVTLPDFYFRYTSFHSFTFSYAGVNFLYIDNTVNPTFIHPCSIIFRPHTLITYLGVPFFLCLGIYLYRRLYTREDLFLSLAASSYILLLPPAIIFQAFYEGSNLIDILRHLPSALATSLAVRYLTPILPMVAILAAKGFLSVKEIHWRKAIVLACIIQALTASFYVFEARKIPADIKAGYTYVAENMPSGTCFLYPHGTLLNFAPHKLMWDSANTMPDLAYLLWSAGEKEAMDILKRYNIQYLFIEKDKIVDDSIIYNYGGFPKSFVEKIPKLGCFSLEYKNSLVEIWKVNETLAIP